MKHILIVDDSSFMRNRIKQALGTDHFSIEEATNGQEALEKCKERRYDCVVTDLLMPRMDGLEMLRNMKVERVKVPVVVLTADIQKTTRTICTELGVSQFLNKPPVGEVLKNAIEQAIAA